MLLAIRFLVLIIAFSLAIDSTGQSSCGSMNESSLFKISVPDIHEYSTLPYSKSVLLQAKIPYKYSIVLSPGKDYIIAVCCDSAYKPVKFKVIDLQNKTIFYDNSVDDFKQFISFTVEGSPMSIIIEVTVLATYKQVKPGEELRSCMGFKVLCRTIGKKGFY